MIKLERFAISKRPYAVDLSSLWVAAMARGPGEQGLHNVRLTAVWFRRRRGTTVACLGQIWDYMRDAPSSATEALQWMDDGRYGGDCLARWDGVSYWSNDSGSLTPDSIESHLAILRPMLENFPAAPTGYDGWWTFR